MNVHKNIKAVVLTVLAGIAAWTLALGTACDTSNDPPTRSDVAPADILSSPPPDNAPMLTESVDTMSPATPTHMRPVFPGETLLHQAAYDGNLEVTTLLINQGADANAKSESGHTPLHLAAGNTNPGVVALLIDHGADVNAKNQFGQTPLHYADLEVAGLLLDHCADVSAEDYIIGTPLHLATVNANPGLAALLLDGGTDVNVKNSLGETPLHVVVHHSSDSDIPTLLLDRGADVNAKDDCDLTPLHFADADVAALLLDRGADVNAKNDSDSTPLHLAARNADPKMVALLLDRGADINAKDYSSQSPLHRAVEILYLERDVLQNDGSWTPQREALDNPDPAMIGETAELLLDRGGDGQAKDAHGRTPCQLAREWEQGNRVLSEKHFQQVVLSPSCLQSFALDAHFQTGFPLQQVVGYLP